MSINGNVKKAVITRTVDGIMSYLQVDPERRIGKTIDTAYTISKTFNFLPVYKSQLKSLKESVDNNAPWKSLFVNFIKETDPKMVQKLVRNFVVNSGWYGGAKAYEITKKGEFNVPYFLLIDPTENCNYNCIGCWAGSYKQHKQMNFETFDRVLTQAKELGMYFTVVSGGEPTLYLPLFDIFKKHSDMAFMFYTNGSMINEAFAQKLKEAGNAVPCISLEGFKEKTDWRRGFGAWDKVMSAMDNLKKAGVLFGYSVTETKNNVEEVLGDEFVDFMINKGAKIAWYFQYIPTGRDPDVKLMLTPQQRMFSYNRIHSIRATKPLFAADFWNDGPYTGGCLAGGRRYLHITADGSIEPCAFIHLAQGNINEMSLKDALKLPFLIEIQKLQPYGDNLLSPCMLVDHPDVMRKIGSMEGVRSTDGTLENLSNGVGKHLDKLSKKWEELSRPVFEKDFPELAKKTREYREKKEEILKKSNGQIEQFYVSEEIEK